MIERIRKIFENEVVKKFSKIELELRSQENLQEQHDVLEIDEDSKGSAIKKLVIQHPKKQLSNGSLSDTVIIQSDFSEGGLSRYSCFLKEQQYFFAKQCDFVFIKQIGKVIYITLCDLKSSPPIPEDVRCKEQFEHTKLFFEYVAKSALASEKYKTLASSGVDEYCFIKVVFVPMDLGIQVIETVTPESDLGYEEQPPFEFNDSDPDADLKDNLHYLEVDSERIACEQWDRISCRFPA